VPPIKHARGVLAAHERNPRFFEFGDAAAYREGPERLRREIAAPGDPAGAAPPP